MVGDITEATVLDELSQSMLNRYAAKSSDTIKRADRDDTSSDRIGRRVAGNRMAASKLGRINTRPRVRATSEDLEDLADSINELGEYEYDQLLQELSKKTVGRYAAKAGINAARSGWKSMDLGNDKGTEQKHLRKYYNRVKGIKRAVKRIGEDTTLDEAGNRLSRLELIRHYRRYDKRRGRKFERE